jgi:F-type H+-transporting ATPase subunit epsilon
MAKYFKLEVITPERLFYEGDCEILTITTTDGRFSFMAGHVPIVMPIEVGTIVIKTPDETIEAFNSEGFLEVSHSCVYVYAQACERPEEIDARRAEDALKRAEERLRQKQSINEYRQSKFALARAMARLSISSKGRK